MYYIFQKENNIIWGRPASLEPASLEPASLEPASLEPASLEPASLEPASLEPASLEPASLEIFPPSVVILVQPFSKRLFFAIFFIVCNYNLYS